MKIDYSIYNTHIENSYLLTQRKSIENTVDWIVEARNIRKLPITRTNQSYTREWLGHNRLYKLGIKKQNTKDVDLNENISIWEEILWLIIGR